MLKSSFLIVLIQALGIIAGFLSIYFVAGDMGPEVYSLVGIYTVVSGVILTFSHLGVETTMMREALYWIEQGDIDKVKEYTMQSINSRFIGFMVLAPIIIGYLLFICFYKYEGDYLLVLLSFYIGSCASALNDSLSLIIRAQGDYVFSTFAKVVNSNVTKFLAIFLYLQWGAMPYLYFYSLIPLPLMIVFIFKIRKNIDSSYLRLSGTIKKIKESKNLWMRSYLDYFSASADSLLVSLLFPPSIIGLYTLYKNFEHITKGFIEGFFDVLSQKCVSFKGNVEKLIGMEHKLNIYRWAAISLIIVLGAVFVYKSDFLIEITNLTKYGQADIIIYCVIAISILYLIGKNEINYVALFAPSKMILKYGAFLFVITLVSYFSVILLPNVYGVLLQRIIIFSITSISAMVLFYRNRVNFYANVNK
jgi:hypothetical protein